MGWQQWTFLIGMGAFIFGVWPVYVHYYVEDMLERQREKRARVKEQDSMKTFVVTVLFIVQEANVEDKETATDAVLEELATAKQAYHIGFDYHVTDAFENEEA